MASKLIRHVLVDGRVHVMKLVGRSYRRPKATLCGTPIAFEDLRVPSIYSGGITCPDCLRKLTK